ncbi:hypothetical protein LIA77_10409 [Sarocladium implicatum]|nr:hypothetical protein LIA77_10409 [Sarocladium implicatum]
MVPGGDTRDLEARFSDERKLRQYTEKVLDKRQEELEAEETQVVRLSHTIRKLKAELREANGQLDAAKAHLEKQSMQLDQVKDHVFRMKPRRDELTENEAKSLYADLCKGIRRWVDSRMSSLDTTGGVRVGGTPGALQASRLVSLLRESGRRCIDVDQSDEYHVFAIVMNYLWLALFSRFFYCPLDDAEDGSVQVWMERLEQSMRENKGEQWQSFSVKKSCLIQDLGAEFSRNWRSDTLRAIAQRPAFQASRDRYLDVLSTDLASLLSAVALRGTQSELRHSIRKNVLDPAAAVAHRLHLAVPVYTLKWPVRHAWSRLEVYECTDLASGGLPIDFTGTVPNSKARKDVTYLFDLAPGLFVERIEHGQKLPPKAISRPQVLVYASSSRCLKTYTTIRLLWDIADPERPPSRANGTRASPQKRT